MRFHMTPKQIKSLALLFLAPRAVLQFSLMLDSFVLPLMKQCCMLLILPRPSRPYNLAVDHLFLVLEFLFGPLPTNPFPYLRINRIVTVFERYRGDTETQGDEKRHQRNKRSATKEL